MQPDNLFGNWLRQRRKTLDLTQAELADRVGCATVTMKKIETGVRRPSKQIAERLALELAIELSTQATFVAFARGLSTVPPTMLPLGVRAGAAHHLPWQPTTFFGRNQELAHLQRLLATPDCRLLTLVGPGGIGKTRLSLEAAEREISHFVKGVYFVELAPLSAAENIISNIAEAVGYQFQQDRRDSKQQLVDYLHEKQLLLVLDNFEHLLEGVPLLVDLLAGAPHLKLLITSRERLNLHGEWVLPIDGLDYPLTADEDHFESYSAVQLFMQSVQRLQPDFSLRDNAPDVLRICQLVEGMPLGLLLAAAWVDTLSLGEISAEIAHSLDFLETDQQNIPTRQRSIHVVFDYSWGLLSDEERAVFSKLSVFRGGFTREAAQQVADASLRNLASLVNKSMLRRNPDSGRYEVHELLRQYAAEHLDLITITEQIRYSHCLYYADFMQHREVDLMGRRQIEALNEIEIDLANIRTAWLWAVNHKNENALDQMLESLTIFWWKQGYNDEGRELSEAARHQLPAQGVEAPHLVRGRLLLHYPNPPAKKERQYSAE